VRAAAVVWPGLCDRDETNELTLSPIEEAMIISELGCWMIVEDIGEAVLALVSVETETTCWARGRHDGLKPISLGLLE
jgi:hypothetical protein